MAEELKEPCSPLSEKGLLGNILLYSEDHPVFRNVIDSSIVSEDFFDSRNKIIFNCMSTLFNRSELINFNTVLERLMANRDIEKIGGPDYLNECIDSSTSYEKTQDFVKIVRNTSILRKIIKAGNEIALKGYDNSTNLQDLLYSTENILFEVTRNNNQNSFKSIKETLNSTIDDINSVKLNGGVTGTRTGFSYLDNNTLGLHPGELIILAARPAMGKTAFALNIACNAASFSTGSIVIFNLEMDANSITQRILSCESEVDATKLKKADLNDDDWNRINESKLKLSNQKIYIDDTPGIKVSDMLGKCRALKQANGDLSLVVIDYLQLIQGSGKSDGNRQQEISEISRQLKLMARELNVPVIALSQLSRSVEKREDKRPMLSDLRESGAIEQDADIVMFMYRSSYYEKHDGEEPNEELVEVTIAKHRNGATATFNVQFIKNISKFKSVQNTNVGE